jgi:prevent-host-death family protein
MTSITSRELNRDVSAAKRAASDGPVTITDHGRPTHVLMTADEYARLTTAAEKFGRRLYMSGADDVDLELPDREAAERELDL